MTKKILALIMCVLFVVLAMTSCKRLKIIRVDDETTTTATQKASETLAESSTTTDATAKQTTPTESQIGSDTTTMETALSTVNTTTEASTSTETTATILTPTTNTETTVQTETIKQTETTEQTETTTATEATTATTTRDPSVPITYPLVELVSRTEESDGWISVEYLITMDKNSPAKKFGYTFKPYGAASNPAVSYQLYPQFKVWLTNSRASEFNAHFGVYRNGAYLNSSFKDSNKETFTIIYGDTKQSPWFTSYDWVERPGDSFVIRNGVQKRSNIGAAIKPAGLLAFGDGQTADYQIKIFILDDNNQKTGIEFEETVTIHYYSTKEQCIALYNKGYLG